MNFDQLLQGVPTAPTGDVWQQVLVRIGGAAVLGIVVALLFRVSRRPHERRRGFGQTLVLLAPLIAMITLAVGGNVAAAFALVGTLAVVRFRTAVRDTRDTVYVIFSVGVGMAYGTGNPEVGLGGTGLIAVLVLVLRLLERNADRTEPGVRADVRLVMRPPDLESASYEPVLQRFARGWTVTRSNLDRMPGELDLRLSVRGTDPSRSPELLAALLELPAVVRAQYVVADDGP